ncbi:hypothetical protein [Buttiauxella sp. A111]|uniref:portal protein n=1 Tax=Buttiauxella sp. A111 TaxID=2563088 RepID=UPI0010D692C6|nr:hypothetical protein [Buttiauxella sp. A111]GDX06350.1 hypothetical protein BSPA111_25590 [Buttiauxella sp. A111]
MNKQELYTEVMRHKDAAVTRQTELADRYAKAWGFYRGELPEILAPGDVAARQVMMESFESVHPSLVAIFTDDQKAPVAFTKDAKSENKLASAVTRAVHAMALGIADWEIKIYLALKEVLISGNQAGLVGYDEKVTKSEKYTYDVAPAQQVLTDQKMLETAGYSIESSLKFEDGEDGPTATGWQQGVHTFKFPVIDLIPFKDFFLSPRAVCPQTANYCAYAEELTNAAAIKRGYKRETVVNANDVDTNNGRSLDTSMLVTGNLNAQATEEMAVCASEELNNIITVFHHYWRGCYNSADEKLYHVVTTDSAYVMHEEVPYCPLIWGAMSVVPNSAHGESLYDRTKSAQENTTRARRSIQRSADFAAYPDVEIVDSMLTPQAKAALNDRTQPGKVYLTKQKGSINRLPTPDVPQAMQILAGEFQNDVEAARLGSAGQSAAEAAQKVQQSGVAIALTQAKDEINENSIAKVFAETFVKPAYRIFLLVAQEIGSVLDIEGQSIPFKVLRDDIGLKVDIKSAGDRANAALNVLQCYQSAAQTGTLPANFTEENKYTIFADYLRAVTNGEDVSRYITPPSEMPKPSEQQQKLQAVMALCQLRHAIATTKLAEAKVQDSTADTQKKLNEAAKVLAEIEEIMEGIDLDKLKLVADIDATNKAQTLEAAKVIEDNNDEEEAAQTRTTE